MYFAMDEIGFENTEKIKGIKTEAKKWKFIYDTAKSYGFEGIHFTPSLYGKDFELDLNTIPDYFQDFKLTLHFGGSHKFVTDENNSSFDVALSQGFEMTSRNNMHDISLHPPNIYGISHDEKNMKLWRYLYANEKIASQWNNRCLLSKPCCYP